jgi:Apea-like HEPN
VKALYILLRHPVPKKFHGSDSGYAIRSLNLEETVSVEDRLFQQGEEHRIPKEVTTLIYPDITTNLEQCLTLAEFSLSLLSQSGHPSLSLMALFTCDTCNFARVLGQESTVVASPTFAKGLTGIAIAQWLRRCTVARANLKARIGVTASRYIRYHKANNLADALMDLCISLESLLDSQTEMSFRFSTCLCRVIGERGVRGERMATLLSRLYDIRSKLAHGDPEATKLVKKIEPDLPELSKLARRILTTYVLYLSEHSRDDWKSYVRTCLFS